MVFLIGARWCAGLLGDYWMRLPVTDYAGCYDSLVRFAPLVVTQIRDSSFADARLGRVGTAQVASRRHSAGAAASRPSTRPTRGRQRDTRRCSGARRENE